MLHRLDYSAFANSCPLQTDIFLFPLIHNHNAYYLQTSFNSVMKGWADKCIGYPQRPHPAHVMTTFLNEIPLKIRQGTVLHFELI